jgi:hypothetical protein
VRLTAEVRWFWEGAPPSSFQEWFVNAGPNWAVLGDCQTRTDEYLVDSSQRALGIKKRGGQEAVEIKGLIESREATAELAGCVSPIELWAKWLSSALALDSAALIKVRKRRWMRKFRLVTGAAVECTGSTEARTSGCDAELTLLAVDGSAWWTFGLEAFGDLEQVENDLAVTVAVLADRNPPALPWGEAKSYPRWLASFSG